MEKAAPSFKTVLDVYVDPGDDVVEYRTNVSGISEDLLNSKRESKELKTFTEAQAMLVELGNNLGGANVYLVGHALINDLKATKVVPFVQKQCIIDTAYLYSYEGVPFKSVGSEAVDELCAECRSTKRRSRSQQCRRRNLCLTARIRLY